MELYSPQSDHQSLLSGDGFPPCGVHFLDVWSNQFVEPVELLDGHPEVREELVWVGSEVPHQVGVLPKVGPEPVDWAYPVFAMNLLPSPQEVDGGEKSFPAWHSPSWASAWDSLLSTR